ncbi:OmpA family protein [Pedobacter hartonius]|uniref:Outer membrane protein OmpA n=1 Tax=Pedobacter hartonius TaxID=425514 RepID=A0A1H3XCV3_9SPHI|nr:OmpA family protein [Pedobacter hartonius]SDZ97169.1 Outer membrane protein OmpA [Pedobacter hartonius]
MSYREVSGPDQSLAENILLKVLMLTKDPKPSAVKKGKMPLAALPRKLEYDNAKPVIRSIYYSNLDQLAKTIKDDNYAVSLRGHADSVGRYKYNWVLSDNRAISVKKYLVSKGVKEDRIVTTPYGSTVPVASNKTAAGRQKNRRVEIELKKISE